MKFRPHLAGVFVLLSTLSVGCKEEPQKTVASRSDAIVAAPGQTSTVVALEKADADPGAPVRQLCQKGKFSLPDAPLSSQGQNGEKLPPTLSGGKILWVNLWAAWCEPCKKELPLLFAWQKEFQKKGLEVELVLLSLDDDLRQLSRFMSKSPEVSVTYYLPEGDARTSWLEAAGLDTDPRLPAHLLVSAEGDVVCSIDGAVEAGDQEALYNLLLKSKH